ncbi:hypothetical protein GCM10022244_01050 [Streptomyces gulbargensis]|uniref:Uncharacterized protein n=1 Tax=Streptomyces gulbargensis TaxID=364901 RepID=A0ABP7L669_9ACTN
MLTLPTRKRALTSMGLPDTRSRTPAVRLSTPSGPENRAIAPGAPFAKAELSAAATPSMSAAGAAGAAAAGGAGRAAEASVAKALVVGASPAVRAAITVAFTVRRRRGDRGTGFLGFF